MTRLWLGLLLLLLGGALCPAWAQGTPQGLTVSAAMSLKDALTVLARRYEEERPGLRVELNLAGSGALQRQIEQGAPADLFVSAGEAQMNALQTAGLLAPGTRCELLGNELVLVVARERRTEIRSFADLAPHARRIAVGNPSSAPVGRYGQEALQSLGLWLALEPRVVYAKDVRAVLAYVESGNADAGLVYRSDARHLHTAELVAAAPPASHARIVYPAAVLAASPHAAAARAFLDFLRTPAAGAVFRAEGFRPLPQGP